MKIRIGDFDPQTGMVEAVFRHKKISHSRLINAVMTEGQYDTQATALRVAEVAAGVAHKIALGLIR